MIGFSVISKLIFPFFVDYASYCSKSEAWPDITNKTFSRCKRVRVDRKVLIAYTVSVYLNDDCNHSAKGIFLPRTIRVQTECRTDRDKTCNEMNNKQQERAKYPAET